MRIQGPSFVHNAQPLNGPHRPIPESASGSPASAQPVDELSISAEGAAISQTRGSADIRADRVARIRAEIASGTYETDAKLDAAVERLLDEVA
ncbi:MAG: flagellar biosynthesis anti-sigma factor FlgM [Planctomycetes bacterium]|nr:flagellar biosynthesis anti-sigma factor FlgM [Planctomycetota bacterium]